MKSLRGQFAFRLLSVLALLLTGAGCYDPKADINAFRPQAEKYLAALDRVGKTVTALPVLTQDALTFPGARGLRFADGPAGRQNVAILHLEELADIGGAMKIYDRVINEEYFVPAVALLQPTKNDYIRKATKESVAYRFQQLLDIQHLVVLRVKRVSTEVTGPGEFTGGEIRGEAFLCEVKDPVVCHGGFPLLVRSSPQVSARVHGGNDATQQNIDRSLAVRADLDEQAVKLIHQRLKSSLPEAFFPSYW